MMLSNPVKNSRAVIGSETFAAAVKNTPPGGQPLKPIEKLSPAEIPEKDSPTPVRRIVVIPLCVVTLHVANVFGAMQVMELAGTTDSVNTNLVQFKPEPLLKNWTPDPLAGE